MYVDLHVGCQAQTARPVYDACLKAGYDGVAQVVEVPSGNAPFRLTAFVQPSRSALDLQSGRPVDSKGLPVPHVDSNTRFRQWIRANITADTEARLLQGITKIEAAINADQRNVLHVLVAVRPTNQESFKAAVELRDKIDLIHMSMAEPLFKLHLPEIKKLQDAGVHFEVDFASALRDPTARRYVIQNGIEICRLTRGRSICMTSGARTVPEVRGPYDLQVLARSVGVKDPSDSIAAAPLRVLERLRKRSGRACLVQRMDYHDIEMSSYRPGTFSNSYTTFASGLTTNTNPSTNTNNTHAFGARPNLGGHVEVIQGPGTDEESSSTSESEGGGNNVNKNDNNVTHIQPFQLDDSSSDDEPTTNTNNSSNIKTINVSAPTPTYPRATSSMNAGSPVTKNTYGVGLTGSYGNSHASTVQQNSPQFGQNNTTTTSNSMGGSGVGSFASQVADKAAKMNVLNEQSFDSSHSGAASREPTFGAGGLGKPAVTNTHIAPDSPNVKKLVTDYETKLSDIGVSGQPADGSSPAQTILKLRQALSSYQQLLEDSEKTVSRLQDARLEQDKQVRMAQRKVARLEADNSEANASLEDAKKNCELWKSKHNHLAETYMEAEVSKCELANLRDDVERLTRELDLSREGETEWKSRAELAESRMENLEKDVKQLSESSKALREEHADAMKELAYRQNDHARVSAQLTDHRQVAQDLQAQLDSFRMNARRSPQPMQGGRSLQGTPGRGGMYDDEMKKKLRLVAQTGDEWRHALERKTRECEYWMNRANKKVLAEPLNSACGTPLLPKNSYILGDQDLDSAWGMSPTREIPDDSRSALQKDRMKNRFMSPDVKNKSGQMSTPARPFPQTPSLPKTPNVPAMRALSPTPKKSPPRDELLDMAEDAHTEEVCDITNPQSLISAMLMAVNLEITLEENEKDNIEDERVGERLTDVENAIQEFLFLQGGTIDQEKAQDKLETELQRQPPKVIRKLNHRFKDMKSTLRKSK